MQCLCSFHCCCNGSCITDDCTEVFHSYVGDIVTVLQRPQTVMYEQYNGGVAGSAAGYANFRTAADAFFPDWEHVNPLHDRLIKKTDVSDSCRVGYIDFFSDWYSLLVSLLTCFSFFCFS